MFITAVKKMISILMSILCLFSWPLFGKFAEKITPKDEEAVRLSFSVISDVHMTDSDIRQSMLELGLQDMQDAQRRLDAFVMLGDNTDHGYKEQYERLTATLSKYDISDNLLLVEGNHDSWTEDEDGNDDVPLAKEYFRQFNKDAAGRDIDDVYYSTEINGYPFIVLGSDGSRTSAYMCDEQLEWFADEMEKASQSGKPIFVLCHWPINQSHGLPEKFGDKDYDEMTGGIGEQSAAVEEIVKSYDNVFYLCGHIHSGFSNDKTEKLLGYNSVESDGSFHSVNLPSYMYMGINGRLENGTGFVVEVYDDSVVFRARSFSAGVWYTNYEYSFDLY